jgi:hypothetical protein
MDASLQALERRWRQTGATEDEARWLAGRLRAGDLPRERLVFAADLGHEASCVALTRPVDRAEAIERLRGGDPSQSALGRLGRVGLVRLALAAVEQHADLVTAHLGPVHRLARLLLSAVRAWCVDPAPDRATRVGNVAEPLWTIQGGPTRPQRTAVLLARRVGEGVTTPSPQAGRSVELALSMVGDLDAVLEAPRSMPAPGLLVELRAGGAENARDGYESLLLQRVQRDVVPWALGERDPLMDR